jgi:pimeloyl-ACP methyl ester carboxylesterase
MLAGNTSISYIGFWLCCMFLLALPVVSRATESGATSADLPALVFSYLDDVDATRAGSTLEAVLAHPDATIEQISHVIQTGRPFTEQPLGTMADERITVRERVYHYALSVPLTYQPSKGYGLVVCLHGAGFTGEAYLERWQSRLGGDYVLVCPTYPAGAWFTRRAEDLVVTLIHSIQQRYHIDPDRIFLTGMSNGGIGAWLIGMHQAPMFAGVAPMASGLDAVLMPFLANLRNTPVYIIHGAKDQVMPVDLSRSISKELAVLGYPHTYREHHGDHPMAGGHYFPREELPDLISWLNHQRRNPLPKRLTLVREATHFQPFSWLRLEATDPIAAFSEDLINKRDDQITRREYAKLDATIGEGNRIEVKTERVQRYSLFLNDQLIDLTKPLTVITNGEVSFEGLVTPSREVLLRQARFRQDSRVLFPIHLTVTVRKQPA